MNPCIRRAGDADISRLRALEAHAFGPEAWSSAAVAEELTGPGRVVLVAEQEGVVVGYGAIRVAGDVADLHRIAVVAERRRCGVASALLAALVAEATAAGAERVLLEVGDGNAAARAFYAACGFIEIDRRAGYYRDGTDALVLQAALADLCGAEVRHG